jgi:four helix bundle protein
MRPAARKLNRSHVTSQLLRTGTSPAPNQVEARGGDSDKDSVRKPKVVRKELKESQVWLAGIEESRLLPEGILLE